MTEEQKNNEEGSFVNSLENETAEKKTITEWESEEQENKKIQNLVSALIIVVGLLVGSLFVDVSQFVAKSGYSERALRDAEIFVLGDKTWVSYEESPIELTILVPDEEGMKDCPECDPTEVVKWLKQNFPTLIAKKIEIGSDEGDEMIDNYGLKTIPSFVFDKEITETEFYQNPQAQAIFEEKDGKFVMNSVALGVPVGKYLEMPEMDEDDAVYGNPDAKTKVIVFSDFQCPYSKMFFDIAMKVMEDYKDKIALVYKDLPLAFHPQAQNAALASRCAQDQDKFWEMAKALYADQGDKENASAWDNQEGIEVFSSYAKKAGLNVADFDSCMKDEKFLDKVNADAKLAGEFGISGTPSGFIGDKFLGGVAQEEQLREMFDEQIEKNK